jgi:predicted Rossmann-fold nucleotide-binding protein
MMILPIPLVSFLAKQRVHLITGAGPGVMEAVSRAYVDPKLDEYRVGKCLDIVPCANQANPTKAKDYYPNRHVEIPIWTHLLGGTERSYCTRNHLIVLTAHAIVALPGGLGTGIECELALTYGKPLLAWLPPRSGDSQHAAERPNVPNARQGRGVHQGRRRRPVRRQ